MQITLQTTGRHTGTLRTVVLYAFADGGRLIVTGSRGGADADPAWAFNLRADGRAVVRRGTRDQRVLAREAAGPERERLWNLVCAGFPMYATYQRRTNRSFPIFVLEPTSDA